jgi:hypothetical protein
MTIRFAAIIGAGCAAAMLLIAPAPAAPLPLTPQVQNTASAAPVMRERKPNRMPTWNTYTQGHADLAFLSAAQYLELAAYDGAIFLVGEHEFSLLDFAAGSVRVVDPDELTEVDLAHDPQVLLAKYRPSSQEMQPAQQAVAASATVRSEESEEDDGILNRILMTFAGALAMASAMRLIIA